jgi:hypothetical protein
LIDCDNRELEFKRVLFAHDRDIALFELDGQNARSRSKFKRTSPCCPSGRPSGTTETPLGGRLHRHRGQSPWRRAEDHRSRRPVRLRQQRQPRPRLPRHESPGSRHLHRPKVGRHVHGRNALPASAATPPGSTMSTSPSWSSTTSRSSTPTRRPWTPMSTAFS